jgi:hypothetical protein
MIVTLIPVLGPLDGNVFSGRSVPKPKDQRWQFQKFSMSALGQKQTLAHVRVMSALCQKQTFCTAAETGLFDHLVGAAE